MKNSQSALIDASTSQKPLRLLKDIRADSPALRAEPKDVLRKITKDNQP